MNGNNLFFKKIESQQLNIKINTFWRLQYFMLMFRKKRGKNIFLMKTESRMKNHWCIPVLAAQVLHKWQTILPYSSTGTGSLKCHVLLV